MSSFAIKQKDILVTNANCTRACVRASSMDWRAPFPRSRLPASVEFINKASMCGSRTAIVFVSEGSKRVKTATLCFKLNH